MQTPLHPPTYLRNINGSTTFTVPTFNIPTIRGKKRPTRNNNNLTPHPTRKAPGLFSSFKAVILKVNTVKEAIKLARTLVI